MGTPHISGRIREPNPGIGDLWTDNNLQDRDKPGHDVHPLLRILFFRYDVNNHNRPLQRDPSLLVYRMSFKNSV